MEVNEKKQILQVILQKLFVGLIFCFGIIGFNMTLNQSTVKADDILKTLSFDLVSERELTIKFPGYYDKEDGHPKVEDWNDFDGKGSITYTVDKDYWEDGMKKYKYTVHMDKVNVSGYTPWLYVESAKMGEYFPEYFYASTVKQDRGLTPPDKGKPHKTGDTVIDEPGRIRIYMGLDFCETRLDVKIGYHMTLSYNGATTKPTAGANYIDPKGNYAVWHAYLHHVHDGSKYHMPDYSETGKIPGIFGKGSIARTGYNFDGWYCGTNSKGEPNYLFDADGNPKKSVWIGSKQWSDSTLPRYMWGLDRSGAATYLTAHWTAKKYNLTLHYMGADKRGVRDGVMDGQTAVYKDRLTYDGSVEGIYGKGTVHKTGYTFNGWYIEDSSKKKVYLWDKNGNLTNENITFNKSSWTIDGKYKFTGNTEVYADWIPNEYNLYVDYNGADTHPKQTAWEHWFTYDSAIKNVSGLNGSFSKAHYIFKGWYCKSTKLFDADGKVVKSVTYNGETWSTGKGIYKFPHDTGIKAKWEPKIFKISLDNQGADIRSGTDVIYQKYDSGYYSDGACTKEISYITCPRMTGYSFYGYYIKKYSLDYETDKVDNSNRIINSSGHIDAAKNRFNETNCPDFDGTYYTTTIYAYWVDDIGPEEDSTYLTVTKTDDKDYVYAKATKSSVSPVSLRLSCTPGTLSQITWNTDWLNKDVSINMYGRDIGKGMKNLLIRRNDSSSWYDWQSKDFSGAKDQVSTSKNDTNESVSDFYGIATDASHKANKLETKSVTVKIDKTAPAARGDDIEGAVHTGTIYRGISSDYVPDSSRTINDDGTINEAAMRTEIKLTLKDSLSGVKFVWAIVKDDEHGTTKTYELTRRSCDDHDGTWAATPNLYEEFPAASNLTVRLYAVDVAGNLTEYKKSDGEPFKVKNFCIYTYTERGDHESPDINYYEDKDNPNPDPLFLLGQYGWVHIYTYGYVESVSVSFPGKVQKAALLDYNRLEATEGIAKADSGNKLGTIVNTRDALVTAGVPNNCNDQLGLDLRPSSTPFDVVYDATGCSRTYDYAFKVPLYLDDDYAMSGNPNKVDPARSIGFLTPTNTWCEANKYYEITEIKTIENAYKNADYEQSTASLYSGGNNPAITHKIHTHLVH